ncbi:MAG: hypothetical protein H6621_13330 [Halobacteriovoraceae bacterium]|nr:hypothetical protein [Halobacteriovoraceae bacterium]
MKHRLEEAQRVAIYIQEISVGEKANLKREEKKEESIESMGSPKNIVIKQNNHESVGKIDELSAIKPV